MNTYDIRTIDNGYLLHIREECGDGFDTHYRSTFAFRKLSGAFTKIREVEAEKEDETIKG